MLERAKRLLQPSARSAVPPFMVMDVMTAAALFRRIFEYLDLPVEIPAPVHPVRQRSPRARVVFVDYLTLLPPDGTTAPPLSAADADLGRYVGTRLEEATAMAAQATGCELVPAGQASRQHHGWSAEPWAVAAGLPLPWRPAPFHPNAAGMRAAADLILEQAGGS